MIEFHGKVAVIVFVPGGALDRIRSVLRSSLVVMREARAKLARMASTPNCDQMDLGRRRCVCRAAARNECEFRASA